MNLGKFLYGLIYADEPQKLMVLWNKFEELSRDYQLIAAIDNYNKNIVYPINLTKVINEENTDFVPYFRNDNIFALDTNIMHSMTNNLNLQIPFDHSVMLDTNYTSYIKGFLKERNKPNQLNDSTSKTLDTLLKNRFNYDNTFYLIENYNNLFSSGDESFTIQNKDHITLYENLYYVELFKSIDEETYIKHNSIKYTISENEARQNVDQIIRLFYSGTYKEELKIFIEMHRNMTLFLVGIWQIQFSSKANAKNKMKKLFDYVVNKVGIYYEREMVIAYKYFENSKAVPMLNKINKGRKNVENVELLEKVENIAWDFLVPRIMEFHINVNKDRSNFIPFFLSHDKKLKELMGMFKIKGVLLHKQTREFIPFSNLDTTRFFKERGLLKELDSFNIEETLSKREMVREYNKKTNYYSITTELSILQKTLIS